MIIVPTTNPDAVEIHDQNGRSLATIRRDWPGTSGWSLVVPSQEGATAVSYSMMAVATKFIEDTSGLSSWKTV